MVSCQLRLGYAGDAELDPGQHLFALREITLGYRLPESLCKKFGANYLRLGFTARNICYLINKLTDGLNPASISSNNPLTPFDIGGVPFYRTYALNLTVRF